MSNNIPQPQFRKDLKHSLNPSERPAIVHEEYVYNFAFGSNIGMDKLKNRAGGIAIESCEAGFVRDHRLAFNLAGLPPIEPTMAGLEPDSGSTCHGSLVKLKRDQYERLYISEGAMAGKTRPYWEHEVTVETYDGRKIQAVAFRTSPLFALPKWQELPPSKRYLDLLIAGAEKEGLSPAYVQYLKNIPTAPPSNPAAKLYARLFAALYFLWLTRKFPGGHAMRVYKGAIFHLYALAEWYRKLPEKRAHYSLFIFFLLVAAYLLMVPGVLFGATLLVQRGVRTRVSSIWKRVQASKKKENAQKKLVNGERVANGEKAQVNNESRSSPKGSKEE